MAAEPFLKREPRLALLWRLPSRATKLVVAVVLVLAGLTLIPRAGAAAAPRARLAAATSGQCQLPGQQTFTYSSDQVQTCTVPSGISSVTVTAIGGQGGTCTTCGPGGQGGEVIATLPVSAGETIRVWVGQEGTPDGGWGPANTYGGNRGTVVPGGAAYNGAGGGGASAVALGTSDSATPLVVAGGGGGGGGNGDAGSYSGAGGAGGAGGNPASNGANGQNMQGSYYNRGYGGDGGGGGAHSTPSGGAGASPVVPNWSAGGGGGGGLPHGGGGGGQAESPYYWAPVAGGGGGGGGGGDSSVESPANALLYTPATTGGNGSVTLSTSTVQTDYCTHSPGTFSVPQNVTHLQVIAVGAQGWSPGDGAGSPGYGARVAATVTLNGQTQLTYKVGCEDGPYGGYGYGNGGPRGTTPGAGQNGGGGGGATALLDAKGPLVVAGGGGGAGGAWNSIYGGGNGGNAGYGPGQTGAGSGTNGSGISPGQGGTGGDNGSIDGQPGEGSGDFGGAAGGGGGGGYTSPQSGGGIGGGDGAIGGGGGGGGAGASYVRAGATSAVSYGVSGYPASGYLLIMYEPSVPSHVRVVGGAGQHAVIGTQFGHPLAVEVTDQFGHAMRGQTVLFVAPTSGASAKFANGEPYMTATTGRFGIATTSALTANQSAGSYDVSAGGINYQAYTTIPLTNDPSPTTMSDLTSSSNPSVVGQPVTFSVTVKNTLSGPAPPSGNVQFTVDGHDVGSAVPVQPVANSSPGQSLATSAPVTFSSVGSHTFGARFLGSANYKPSSISSGTQIVGQAATTTRLASSANPSALGQPVTFAATVAAAPPGAGTPTGTVTFKDWATTIGTGTLSGGKATLRTSGLSAGTHYITAVYRGDSNFTGSISSPVLGQVVLSGPAASISTPINGASYALGQVVDSSFTCTDTANGPGIESCLDQNGNPPGSAVDTSTAGQHTFTVTARSWDGLSSQSSVTYTVSAATAAPPAGCQDPTGAYNLGFNAGFTSGFDAGFSAGFSGGFRAGFRSGFNDGFRSSAGHAAAGHSSLAAGGRRAISAQAIQPACDSAFNQGFNTGFNTGFNSGFQKGFNSGFSSGFHSGFNDGYKAGRRRR